MFKWKSISLSFATAIGVASLQLSPVSAATTTIPSHTYVIRGNETFWTISRQFHLPLSAVLSANPTLNPLNLYPGLTVKIPAALSTKTTTTIDGRAYGKEVSCIASAYTAAPSENGWGAVDYFGNPLKLGTIAVDPSVIPLGSTVFVTGYSFDGLPSKGMLFHATDEGSAIKGNRVDIFLPTSQAIASNFGLQHVKVYVLK